MGSSSKSIETKLRTEPLDNSIVCQYLLIKSYNCLAINGARPELTHEKSRKTVIVIVGMPGAGKSLASSVMKTRKVPVFVSGDIVRTEARRRNLKFTRKNLGELMLRLRREEGMGAVAKRLIPMVEKAENRFVVYEGARSVEEVDELRRRFDVITIAIHASSQARYRRLLRRGRSDRPRGWSDFVERDNRELGVGISKLIALADRTIENEDTKADLKRRTKRLLKTILQARK